MARDTLPDFDWKAPPTPSEGLGEYSYLIDGDNDRVIVELLKFTEQTNAKAVLVPRNLFVAMFMAWLERKHL